MILIATGRSMDHRIAVRDQLVRGKVSDAMRPPPPVVPADMSLIQALDSYLRGAGEQGFPVVDAGRVIGTISIESARKVGGRDPMRPVRDGVRPLAQTPVLAPDETLDDAVEWLGGRQGLVLRDGVLVGVLGPGDVERWYRRVIEGRDEGDDRSRSEPPTMTTPAPGSVPPRPDLP
jgi:predicted transcriptional regulator